MQTHSYLVEGYSFVQWVMPSGVIIWPKITVFIRCIPKFSCYGVSLSQRKKGCMMYKGGSCVIIFIFKSFYHLAPFLSNDFSADGMFFVHGISRFEGECAGFSWGFKCFLLASDLVFLYLGFVWFYIWAICAYPIVCLQIHWSALFLESVLKENSEYSRGFCYRMFLFSYPRVWFCAIIWAMSLYADTFQVVCKWGPILLK